MDIYRELGVEPVIDDAGTATRYGGSLMAPEVLDTMRRARNSLPPSAVGWY